MLPTEILVVLAECIALLRASAVVWKNAHACDLCDTEKSPLR